MLYRRGGGSSPLTRGKLDAVPHARDDLRLIPAHAGKTVDNGDRANHRPAHPRSRGENACYVEGIASTGGSSPLTRGKRPATPIPHTHRGLIPAHAGKTLISEAARGVAQAHPRSRGENSRTDPIIELMPGSSPLTRGKRGGRRKGLDLRRLIPAHAGKTGLRTRRFLLNAAHPRSRGENQGRKSDQ